MNSRITTESARRVSDVVSALLRSQPFFGSLALRLPLVADSTRKTLACDGQNIRYSQGWIAGTDAHQIETSIARVVLACSLKHHTRRGDRDPERWQKASQNVTHSMLMDAGFTLPADAEAWDDMSVEEAYSRLEESDQEEGGSNGDPQDYAGMATPGSAGADEESGEPDHSDSPDGQNQPGQQVQPDESVDDGGHDDSGDSEQSEDDPSDDPQDSAGSDIQESHDPSGTGEVMDASPNDDPGAGLTDEQKIEEEQAWDEAMHQSLNLAKAEGRVPGHVRETIEDAHTSIMDWRTLLRRYMKDAVSRDYSWSLPNRRFIDEGLYLPSIRSEGINGIAVIIDTSSSIWSRPEILTEFWGEVRQVVMDLQPEDVIVLQVDDILQDVSEYSYSDLPEEIELKGDGGTDFRPGFAWLEEQGKQPGVCLYLTDMECNSYPDEPPFGVVWVNWGGIPDERYREPWGERIDMGNI